ncbi:MAG: GAF domain-containing protein [Anaerolineales bacterium]|nr:GAF domain-containing protein [Anaerolineales bacterium]MCB8960807.1 GAF domain-containing protein [Ardenticatenales bacterium]
MHTPFHSSLTWRNSVALFVLSVVAFICFAMMKQTVVAQQDNAARLVLVSQQPQLADSIAVAALELVYGATPQQRDAARDSLARAINQFEENHRTLTRPDLASGELPLTSSMSNLYFNDPFDLDDQVLQYLEAAVQLQFTSDPDLTPDMPALTYLLEQREGRLMSSLQGAVNLQQASNEAEVQQQDVVLWAAIGAMLLSLALVGLIIFVPLQRLVRQRSEELITTNQRLQGQNEAVGNLTRDMELAAEIGQVVTEIQDLDALLIRAVDLVRSRFDLYYTQIYMTDPNRRSLLLRAGTGEVGRTLMDRGHRLAVAPDSINGIAAYERRSLIVADTEASAAFRPNVLLPETRSEMAVPILYQDEILGVLNLQSAVVNGLSSASLPAFEAIAGQLAVAIVNANLFEVTRNAQEEMALQARRLTEAGWSDFLNAVDRGETIGYVYDQSGLKSMNHRPRRASHSVNTYSSRIAIAGTTIGQIQLTADPDVSWSEEQLELVDAISQQVARQLDNIRLLAEADRYREQADLALRRLTGEAWSGYAKQRQLSNYLYDGQKISLLSGSDSGDTSLPTLVEPLEVRGEIIGEVAVNENSDMDEDAPDLIAAVAERLSSHLENLRLNEQMERALNASETQAERLVQLNELGASLSNARTLEEVLTLAAVQTKELVGGQRASLALFNPSTGVLTIHDLDDEVTASIMRREMAAAGTAMEEVLMTGHVLSFADIRHSEFVDNVGLRELDIRSRAIAPLITQQGVIGTINVGSVVINDFDQTDLSLMQQLASLLAATIDNRRLLSDAQRQAYRERMVNQITQKIQGARTIDGALQTAVEELGRTLKARQARVQLGSATVNGTNGTSNGRVDGYEELGNGVP